MERCVPAAAPGVSLAPSPDLEVAQGQVVGQSLERRRRQWKTGAGVQLWGNGGGKRGPCLPHHPAGQV